MKPKDTAKLKVPPKSEIPYPAWINSRLLMGLAAILSVIVFYPVINNGFVWDDTPYVTENPYFRKFTSEIFGAFWMGNYHPLTLLSLYLDFLIAENNPLIYHLHNLVLHLGSTLLIGFLLTRYSGNAITGWLGGLLYAVHPIHVESVAWISERKDLIYGFYYFAALLAWDEFRRTDNRKFQILTLLLFVLSCLGKGMAVTLPAVIVLLDYFHYNRKILVIVQDTIAGFLVSLIFSLVAIAGQKESSAMREGGYYSVLDHAAIGFTGWFHYLQKLICPYPLSAVYTMPLKDPVSMLFPKVFYICSFAFPLVNGLILWKGSNRVRVIALSFTVSVVHVLFAPVGSAMASDRYMYVPSLFFCWGIAELVSLNWKRSLGNIRNGLVIGTVVLVIPVFSWLTMERTKLWESNFILFSDVAKQYPHDLLANNNIGLHYVKTKEFDKAREAYTRVVTHYPMDYTGYFNMGVSYNLQEKGREAMYYFKRVFELNPGYKDLNSQFGVAALFAKSNDTAVFFLKRALASDPNLPDHYFNLALAYSRVGELDESDNLYQEGLKRDPTRINTYLNLAYNERKRNNSQAEAAYVDLAVDKGIDRGTALRNMGIMLGGDEDYAGARYYYEKAVILNPKDAEALYNLAISYEKLGDLNTAIPIYIQAARLDYGAAKDLLDRNRVQY